DSPSPLVGEGGVRSATDEGWPRARCRRSDRRMTVAASAPASPRPRAFWTAQRRDWLVGYLLIAPQVIGIAVFVLVPLGLVFWYSLHEWNVLANSFTFTGAANY